ncbi:esterase B1-like [Ctenocephalides felis]|uniref:esterase B1-like n=1 Tax=Ctenocephalides felis TaxID=7515 RepID=UPI000E6E12F6|nr:esterase B1-like [Ctenocephalides felis]
MINVFNMNKLYVVVLFFAILQCVLCEPLVKVTQGMLRGKEYVTDDGQCYHAYKGIPYAKAPLGHLRFKAPQEPESWFGVRKAFTEGNICKQYDLSTGEKKIAGDEDCLYLNVYTPKTYKKTQADLPVMVWLHGGGFLSGSGNSDTFGPDWLVARNMVVVTLNYRLGPFGFLNLGIADAPGNMGLKDQVAALQWVQDNIDGFGGDPKNVTLAGSSAGAASVNYLVLSENTKDLFQKAAILGGSALNPWAVDHNPKENAYKLSEALGHIASSANDALDFLKSASADDIIQSVGSPPWSTIVADENHLIGNITFVPSIEKELAGEKSIITSPVKDIIKSGNFQHVPMLFGFADGEGILAYKDAKLDPVTYGLKDVDFGWYVPKELCLTENTEKFHDVAEMIKKFYCGEDVCTDFDINTFMKIKGDTWIIRGIDNMVNLLAQHSSQPIYYYEFAFDEFGLLRDFYGDTNIKGACHADDRSFFFKNKNVALPKDVNENVNKTHQRFMEIISNFVNTGNPTYHKTEVLPIDWQPVTKDTTNYLSIGKDLELKTNPKAESLTFWRNLIVNETDCNTEKEV